MKNQTRWMGVLLLACLLVTAGLASAGLWDRTRDVSVVQPAIQQKKVITVSGYGTVDAHPDEALVGLAVVTQAEDAKSASEENARKMGAVLAALDKLGIAPEDIVTSDYSVRPNYDWSDEEDRIVGFQVRNSLEVMVRDIGTVEDVLDVALGAGANEIDDVTFTVSDDPQIAFRNKAIELAVSKAEADAKYVADATNVRIVGPVEISTTGSQLSPYRAYVDYESGYEGMPVPMPTPALAGAAPQINPGDVTVSAYVTVVYEFE